jgi:hypothetical protein
LHDSCDASLLCGDVWRGVGSHRLRAIHGAVCEGLGLSQKCCGQKR